MGKRTPLRGGGGEGIKIASLCGTTFFEKNLGGRYQDGVPKRKKVIFSDLLKKRCKGLTS